MLYAKKHRDATEFTSLKDKKEFVEYIFNALQQRDTRYIYTHKKGGLLVVYIHDGKYDATPYLDYDWYSYLVMSDILYSQRGWV